MAIVKETVGKFIHTYSDTGYRIKQVDTGLIYDDAMDIEEKEYTETEEKIMEDSMAMSMMDNLR